MGLTEMLLNPAHQEHFDLFLMIDLIDRNDPGAYDYFCKFRHEFMEELLVIRQVLSHPELSGLDVMLGEIIDLRDQLSESQKRIISGSPESEAAARRSPADRLRKIWERRQQ